MKSLEDRLTDIVANAFSSCGFDQKHGQVAISKRPDLCQFQCNGAMAAAKQYKVTPRQIARRVVDALAQSEAFAQVALAGPGFINLTVSDAFLSAYLREMALDDRLGCAKQMPIKVIVDYGGANIAKPLHVGHLRAAIIGESLKRLARFMGHEVLGDVHLGDWGLQMGMIISELERRQPDLPYFDPTYSGPYPDVSPVTVPDLEEMYPAASARVKREPEIMKAARQATFALQQGHAGYRALWQHIFDVSVADLKTDYAKLAIEFDLWLGESDTQERISSLIQRLQDAGWACESQGALVIDVTEPEDTKEIPPLLLVKSDGAVLYGTTDLATIEQRVQDFDPEIILYVVDKRQSDHFCQVFRGAYKTGIAPEALALEHIGFGTMNGFDGKPFKTRAGGVMKLKDLIEMVTKKALDRMAEHKDGRDYDPVEKCEIAHLVGVATLKFADLVNHYVKDYVFDLDRFSLFKGRTGPYLLYMAVRAKSILDKASAQGIDIGVVQSPASDIEREMMLKIADLPDVLATAWQLRSPNHLCEYAFSLAILFSRFYDQSHVLHEEDDARQAAWLGLVRLFMQTLMLVLDLLGIQVPEQM
ncbi:MAG: arginine--tRNA ligase [Anaerolineae bacterium]|nr:arginine--tRNA ligase [Anaerolineae bacterium]